MIRVQYLRDGRTIAHVVPDSLRGRLRDVTAADVLGCRRARLDALPLGAEALVEDPLALNPELAATDHVRVIGGAS